MLSYLQFLIQSDFDTSANRQDILTTSRRNVALLSATAEAFLNAVQFFLEDVDLQYEWPVYLPSPDEAAGGFWSDLHPKIVDLLRLRPVIFTRYGTLKKVGDVKVLAGTFTDESEDEPLLDDPNVDLFISKAYRQNARQKLRDYGLRNMDAHLAFQLIRNDLKDTTSKIKWSMSDKNHTRLANYLQLLLTKGYKDSIRSLEIVPVGLRWVSFMDNPDSIFFPWIPSGIKTPLDLHLDIVDSSAVSNQARRSLFEELGVKDAPLSLVQTFTVVRCSTVFQSQDVSLSCLRFLYAIKVSDQAIFDLHPIRLYGHPSSSTSSILYTLEDDIYMPDESPYGPKLLKKSNRLPGLDIIFLSSYYFRDEPEPPSSDFPPWRSWLQKLFGIRKDLRLVNKEGNDLSSAWYYITKHQPTKTLGLLQHLWTLEKERIQESQGLIDKIKDTNINEMLDGSFPGGVQLRQTYLPFPSLVRQCFRFLQPNERFPFLDLGSDVTEERINSDWRFLTEFGVRGFEDIEFFLEILLTIKATNYLGSTLKDPHRVFNLYRTIYFNYFGFDRDDEKEAASEQIRSVIRSNPCSMTPANIIFQFII